MRRKWGKVLTWIMCFNKSWYNFLNCFTLTHPTLPCLHLFKDSALHFLNFTSWYWAPLGSHGRTKTWFVNPQYTSIFVLTCFPKCNVLSYVLCCSLCVCFKIILYICICLAPANMCISAVGSLWLFLRVVVSVLWHPPIVLTRSLMPALWATAPGWNGSSYALQEASCVRYSWVPYMMKRRLVCYVWLYTDFRNAEHT